MKIKLHFNRVNMARGLRSVWSAHTSKACNSSDEILIRHNGVVIGKTVFRPEARQPRAHVEFFGQVTYEDGRTVVDVSSRSMA